MIVPQLRWRAPLAFTLISSLGALVLGLLFTGESHPGPVYAATKPSQRPQSAAADTPASTRAGGYVGAAECAKCHRAIYRSFTQTHMGRSFFSVTPSVIRSFPLPASIYSQAFDRHYDVFSRDGKLYQSEYQTAPDGKDIFRNTREIESIVGSGANGFNGLVRRGDGLFEAPVAFYSSTKRWDLSPGYEHTDLGFNRAVPSGCITCHTGQPGPAGEGGGLFDLALPEQSAIGCENCHGPGAAHVDAMRRKNPGHRDLHIVNPDNLTASLENDICMSCHEAADARVPRPGKTFRDFRPGTPLDDTMFVLMVPPRPEEPNDTDHVQHYFQMSMSRCFQASGGQMRCTSCHDPHVEPTHEQAPAFFNAKCMSCHTSHGCTAPTAVRSQTTPADNCIGCHMPRRDTTEISHSSLTNHRILARPGEKWPERLFRLTTASLPDLVYLNRSEGRVEEPPALSLLEAYRELSGRRPEYRTAYLKTLANLETSQPENAQVQLELGQRDLDNGVPEEAIDHLRHSLRLDPKRADTYATLSRALAAHNQPDEAIAASEKAIALDPINALYQKELIDGLIEAKQYDRAIATMEHYLDVFPEDSTMRKMLAIAKE
jgi:predicted CXXCH cytochrome family protein